MKRITEQEHYLRQLDTRSGKVEENQLNEYRKSAENRLQFFKDKKAELEKESLASDGCEGFEEVIQNILDTRVNNYGSHNIVTK